MEENSPPDSSQQSKRPLAKDDEANSPSGLSHRRSSGLATLWAELKRRKVMRVGITYAVVAWIAIQVSATVFPQLGIPDWAAKLVTLVLLIGFPVALIITWAFELTPEGIKTTKHARVEQGDAPVSKKQQRSRNWMALGFAAGLPTLIFGALAVFFYFRSDRSPAPVDAGPPSAELEASQKSIAVLPLANMSPDPDNAFFADGVQEDILTNLSKIGELIVISRSSTLQFRNPDRNLKQVGTELGVRYLVEGSVRRAGDRVRVTVQLIDGTTDEHVWAETYDRSLDDIFAIQSEVAKTIADKLQAVLSPVEIARIDYRPTENQEAYDNWIKYMQLLGIYSRRWDEKVAYLERAVELDPGFSEAWAQLGVEYFFWGRNKRDEDLVEKGRRTLEKAVQMERESAYALSAQAIFAMYDRRDYDEAIALAMEALAIEPNHLPAQRYLAWTYMFTGRRSEEVYYYEKALQSDPLSHHSNLGVFSSYIRTRQWDKALELGRKNLERYERSGEDIQIGWWRENLATLSYVKDGDLPAYIRALEGIPNFSERRSLAARHALLVRDLPKALKLLEEGAFADLFIVRGQRGGSDMLRLLLLWELGERDKLQSFARAYRAEHEDFYAFLMEVADGAVGRLEQREARAPQTLEAYYDARFAINMVIADAVEGRQEQMEANAAKMLGALKDLDDVDVRFYARVYLAIACLVSGDEESAIEHLEAASRMEYPRIPLNRGLDLLFLFDRLRGNPRYEALLEDRLQ